MAKQNDIKYLSTTRVDRRPKKYCRFKKLGIKYIDYKDAEFLKKFPGPALEVGSGSGRLMFPLLQMGFEIEGLELSADMLALGYRAVYTGTVQVSFPVPVQSTTWGRLKTLYGR